VNGLRRNQQRRSRSSCALGPDRRSRFGPALISWAGRCLNPSASVGVGKIGLGKGGRGTREGGCDGRHVIARNAVRRLPSP
jgi:hypothetical protein